MVLLAGSALALPGGRRCVLSRWFPSAGAYAPPGSPLRRRDPPDGHGAEFDAVRSLSRTALVLVPAALVVPAGFACRGTAWRDGERAAGRDDRRRARVSRPHPCSGANFLPRKVAATAADACSGSRCRVALRRLPLQARSSLCAGPASPGRCADRVHAVRPGPPARGAGRSEPRAPISALISGALLYRAHRRRRLRVLGPTPPRRKRGVAIYRTRVGIAAGTLLLLLVSPPFVPAVAGIGDHGVRYTVQPTLPKAVTGQFLVTPHGPVKLFSWQDPQATYPTDALRVHARDVTSLVSRAAALDETSAYKLFDLATNRSIPLAVHARAKRSLSLEPVRRLPVGRYVFTATHEGRRARAYVTVPPGRRRAAHRGSGAHRAGVRALPRAAALVATFRAAAARSWRRRHRAEAALGQRVLSRGRCGLRDGAAPRLDSVPLSRLLPVRRRRTVAFGAGSALLLCVPAARDLCSAARRRDSGRRADGGARPVDVAGCSPAGRPPANSVIGGRCGRRPDCPGRLLTGSSSILGGAGARERLDRRRALVVAS